MYLLNHLLDSVMGLDRKDQILSNLDILTDEELIYSVHLWIEIFKYERTSLMFDIHFVLL